MAVEQFSRRDFIKLSGVSVLGFFTPRMLQFQHTDPDQFGRIINESATVYDSPSHDGKPVRVFWRDTIVPIEGTAVSEDSDAYNRVWYKIRDSGYAYSGIIQPVKTFLNPIVDIQQGGQLAEVTVPFTDVRWGPGINEDVAYRFYYETTHWIIGKIDGPGGNTWYQILDDKWELIYFAPAEHFRLIPNDELSTLSPEVPLESKRIEVRTVEQLVIAYEWEQVVFAARAATGARFSDGNYPTPPGTHYTFHKRPSRHMAAGNLAFNGYDLPGVPWVSYITKEGVAFHGTFWHNDYGRPRSHGCINLTPKASKWIYRWTLPSVPSFEQRIYEDFGTRVDVI